MCPSWGSAESNRVLIINHEQIGIVSNIPQAIMDKVGLLRWFFTHASVGGNMVTGMNELRASDTNRYQLAIYNYNGNDNDTDYHGAIATLGSQGGADYRAGPPPATINGLIYECQRGNPDWMNKIICFSNSISTSGWCFPKVNVVMDKFCWIDPWADPEIYCTTMDVLERAHPETLFVYLSLPLTTETVGTENDQRNEFNRQVRGYCEAHSKWLLDVADIQAWATNGVESTYTAGTTINQRMTANYAINPGGGDFHLNATGRRQMALAWYALAANLFQVDRDADGVTDGDELIAGTQPTNHASQLNISQVDPVEPWGVEFKWPGISNRYYAIEHTTNFSGTTWTTLYANITGTPPLNTHTVSLSGVTSQFYRLTVQQ